MTQPKIYLIIKSALTYMITLFMYYFKEILFNDFFLRNKNVTGHCVTSNIKI